MIDQSNTENCMFQYLEEVRLPTKRYKNRFESQEINGVIISFLLQSLFKVTLRQRVQPYYFYPRCVCSIFFRNKSSLPVFPAPYMLESIALANKTGLVSAQLQKSEGFSDIYKQMKATSILLLLCLSYLIVAQQTMPPQILSISSSPTNVTRPVLTSLRGGAMIYIKAIGHSPMATDNKIFVGNFPCIIPSDGVTDTYIACVTTETGSNSNINNLPVSLIAHGLVSTSSYPDSVYFVTYKTPYLTEMFPASGFAYSTINYYGIHRIADLGDGLRVLGDVVKMLIGNDLCSRFDVLQAPLPYPDWYDYIRCTQSHLQTAGKYNVSEQVLHGFADRSIYLRKTSLIPGEYFEFAVLPTVTSVSPAQGNLGGQYITVAGTGFSAELKNNSVTVDGNPCEVTYTDEGSLRCTLAPRGISVSSLLTTTSGSQTKGYLSGAGITYARYTYSGSLSSFITAVRSNNVSALGAPNQKGYRAELKEGDVHGSYRYGQTWSGYFTAPVSGEYTFIGTADDQFSFYLATVTGSAETPATPFISSTGAQYWNDFYLNYKDTATKNVTLSAGMSYYFEAYHINIWGGGNFKIEVGVPNTDASLPFQTYQVDQIVLNSTVQPEVLVYTMNGGNTGSFTLQVFRKDASTGQTTYDVSVEVAYGCSASTFANALNSFDLFSSYAISVTRVIYGVNNTVLSTTVGATKIEYTVSVAKIRPVSITSQSFIYTNIDYNGVFIQPTAALTAHSPPISGTFTLSIGGVLIDPHGNGSLHYSTSPSTIQDYLRKNIQGFENVEVSLGYQYSCEYSCFWIIKYKGYNKQVQNIVVSGAGLSGGVGSPSISNMTMRNYSPNIIFSPIDYRFLGMASATPSVIVKTNGVQSICTGTCGYNFVDYSEITSLSSSGSVLTLALSDTQGVGFTSADVTITVQGKNCPVDSTPVSALTCTLPTLVAGTVTPLVYIKNLGIARLASGVSPITVPLVVTAINDSTGGSNGGYVRIITGSGFPTDISKISVTICSALSTIITSSSTSVSFYVPECLTNGSTTVTVAVGGLTDSSLFFGYGDITNAPTILGLTPKTANPGSKGTMIINGVNFGSDGTGVKVFLTNSSGRPYQLNVLDFNSTGIKVGLSGGLAGDYKVKVNIPVLGDSVAFSTGDDIFSYKVTVTSVSPSTGSINGGSLITITGTNFDTTAQQTLVFIGQTINWICSIESITSTTITCRVPAISEDYSPGDAQDVVVTTRLIVQSKCEGTCKFTYLDSASSPAISALSVASGVATITGTSLTSGSSCEVVLVNTATGASTVLATTTCAPTSATWTIPTTVASAKYLLKIRNPLGESNSKALTISWNRGSADRWQGSTAGTILKFTGGSGYPVDFSDPAFSVATIDKAGVVTPAKVISCCTGNAFTMLAPGGANNVSYAIWFYGPALSWKAGDFTPYSNYTATIGISSSTTVPAGSNTITLTKTNTVSNTIAAIQLVSTKDPSSVITIPTWTTVDPTTFTFIVTLAAGSYSLRIRGSVYYFSCTDILKVSAPGSLTSSSDTYSYNGGYYTITGTGLSPVSQIIVNGFVGKISEYTNTAVTYRLPAFVTTQTQSEYTLTSVQQLDLSTAKFFSDPLAGNASAPTNVSAAFDGSITTVYGSLNAACWIGIDVGQGLAASVNRFRFFPYLGWNNTVNKILDATFQGTNDLTASWNLLAKADQTVHSGWNVIASKDTTPYRYIRFSHNSTSQCNIAEFQLFGITYSSTVVSSLASKSSDVVYSDGFNSITLPNQVAFASANTAIITSISPKYGDIFGGYTISFTGLNLDFATPTIIIDGIPCTSATSVSPTLITCIAGARPALPKENTLVVKVGSSIAILRDTFYYVLKWSDSRTWGVDLPPIDGDLVYVPQGMTLLIDQDTPILKGIAANNGTLIFSDEKDITVQTGFITLVGGRFIAGTEQKPHLHTLNFIMYGGYYDTQQPMFGNKGIGCLQCKFSMYGKPKQYTWTMLSNPVNPTDSVLTVKDPVDWVVGDEIVVASTSFFHWEAERRTITAISGTTITVNQTFQFKHAAATENYGASDKLPMIAEVGLLTRNIKMRGDDATSVINKYGSHLMISGKSVNGAEGHVAYSEFFHCGQPAILGRYCIHFHMAGQVPTSFVRGNAVHDSFARVVTIHGVHFLTVQFNVGYRVRGHNFFVQDGIETHNVIRHNLAIGSLVASNMLQTDTSVASFWVTNPSNDFYGNHAAGSDFYGIWYEIKPNPDGPSATNDVCPIGNPLGDVRDNVGHSNVRFGLRIFTLYARQYPCEPIRDDKIGNNPWQKNPSITSTYKNFILYKNMEDGVLAEQTGDIVFQNFTVGENYRGGFEFYLANFTRKPPLVLDSAIIGKSQTNAASDPTNYTLGMSGLITPRSGVTNFTNIRFYSFPAGSILIQTCVLCDDPLKYTNLGTEILLKQLTLTDIAGKLLFMIGLKRDVIYDMDGSLSLAFDSKSRSTGATIVHGFPHIANTNPDFCPPPTDATKWDGAVMCNSSTSLRRVGFTNLADHQDFQRQFMKAIELTNVTDTVPLNMSDTLYTAVPSNLQTTIMEPKFEKKYTWALPFITGRIYNIWWGTGIDFTYLDTFTSPSYLESEKGIIFKFNYSDNRELYRVGPKVGGVGPSLLNKASYVVKSQSYLDPNTCENGDFYHDNTNNDTSLRMFTLCQSGKNRSLFEYTSVTGVICELLCPPAPGTFVLENFVRKWSNATQWPNGVVPVAGDNVTVKGEWRLLLDVDPAPINNFTIDGNLIIDDTRDVTIIANFIHIRAGNLSAGSTSNPFTHKLTIQINGNKQDSTYVIDPSLTGNKLFVITGFLNLVSNPPETTIATLTQTVLANTNTIVVDSCTGWAVGDTLAFGPSFNDYSQYQTANIASIDTTTKTITLSSALKYTHYGANSVTVQTGHGDLDARTKVGHLNRNIKIVAGSDSGWGFSTVVYGYTDTNKVYRVGTATLIGVQFLNGGQLDSTRSPLVFQSLVRGNYTSVVKSSTFVNCKAFCIKVDTANNITLTNNVLYNAWVFAVQVVNMKSFTFNSNLIIGVDNRPTMTPGQELVACFSSLFYVNAATDKVSVKDNFCQGSAFHGWAIAQIKCDELEINPFANNTIGSAQIGFIFNNIGESCQAFSYIKAYACGIGQISGAPSTTYIVYEHFIMADNGRGVTLKHGASEGKTNHTAYFSNSYITPVSRPSCVECYGTSATRCVNNIGIRMYTASANGEVMPGKFGAGFDVICKQPVYDSKAFLKNVIFDNFKQAYTGGASACSSNFAFRPHHGGFDMVGGHNLFNSPCKNCDNNSYLYADTPNPDQLGWFGGCGDILCTGFNNYLITDWTGDFMGMPGQIIGNNSVIGSKEAKCVFSTSMNSYNCLNRTDFAVLEYQSIAPDFNKRIMWPVNLTYEGSGYTTVTNGWREWEWLGKEPQNQRFGRFVSIVTLQKVYNMTFSALPPLNLQLQLQKRTNQGNSSNYIIVKLHYPLPNSIRVTVNNVIQKPILLTDYVNASSPGLLQSLDTTKCGSNIYYYTNSTIQFVITEAADCVAVISLVDSISLTTHFAVDINTFFSGNHLTSFINNLCALLKITDTSRVKVVGVYSGSVILNTQIQAASTTTPTAISNSSTTSNAADLAAINTALTQSISSGTFASSMVGVGAVTQVQSTTNYLTTPTTETSQSVNIGLIVGVAVGSTVLVALLTFGVMWIIRKRAKVMQEMISEESFPQEHDGEKNHDLFTKNHHIHPEQSNIMLRNKDTRPSALEVKDAEVIEQ